MKGCRVATIVGRRREITETALEGGIVLSVMVQDCQFLRIKIEVLGLIG